MKKSKPYQTIIQNCHFNGGDNASLTALAEAIKANAEAIKALAVHCSVPGSALLVMNDGNISGSQHE